MNQYKKYKDSKVEWIGEIPEHWGLKKLKYLVLGKLEYGANEPAEFEIESDPRYIRITDFGENGKLREDTFKSLPPKKANEYLLKNGDILFARSGATVGKTFQFKDYKGSACYAGYLIKATPDDRNILSDFLYFYTKSAAYENWKNSIFNQSTIQNIGADKYSVLEIPIPQLKEQISINQYLDDKTAKMDKLIDYKQQLIELLKEERTAIINQAVTKGIDPKAKLKPSGIEWLGDIPDHWIIKKVKYLLDCFDYMRIPLNADQRGGGEKIYDYYGASGVIDKVTNYLFDGDYILIGEDGANLLTRSTALAYKATGKFWVNNHAHILKPKDGNIDYFTNLLETINYSIWVTGSAQPKLTADNLMNIPICDPPIEEQNLITNKIKHDTQAINYTISRVEKEIDLIKEYRASLISEVVTGKIKVI
jgi:type I restriction enzyme S subunit